MTPHRESGNALWFILIAILLLGGLTVLMSRGSSTSDDSGDFERNRVLASEMMRYSKSISLAVDNLISRGCSETQLSFWYDGNGDGVEDGTDRYYNPTSPVNHTCHVFMPEGGAVTYVPVKDDWLDPTGHRADFVAAEQCVAYVGTGDTSCADANTDLMFEFVTVKKALCMAVNDMVGIPNPSGAPPQEDHASARFIGSFAANTTPATALITSPELDGKDTGCFTDSSGSLAGQNIFYHVIYAR